MTTDSDLPLKSEVSALAANILRWLQEHAPDYARGPYNPGATEAELTAVAEALGRPLPPELAALLRVVNGDVYFGEYNLLSTQQIAYTWGSSKKLLDEGPFARFEPHHDSRGLLKPGWWHPGLLPVLEDSGGNELCIDLDPGPRGVVGQMVWWEVHEGPIPHGADSLLTLLRRHWQHLSSGKYASPEAWEASSCWELTQA